jgi:hypothetical protein
MMDSDAPAIVKSFLFQYPVDHDSFFGIILKIMFCLFKGAETTLTQGQYRQVMGLSDGQVPYGQQKKCIQIFFLNRVSATTKVKFFHLNIEPG